MASGDWCVALGWLTEGLLAVQQLVLVQVYELVQLVHLISVLHVGTECVVTGHCQQNVHSSNIISVEFDLLYKMNH